MKKEIGFLLSAAAKCEMAKSKSVSVVSCLVPPSFGRRKWKQKIFKKIQCGMCTKYFFCYVEGQLQLGHWTFTDVTGVEF